MRPLIVLIGIVIVIGGVVLAVVPVDPVTSKDITASSPSHYHISERVPVLPSEPVSLSWSSNVSTTVILLTCSSIYLNASSVWAQCTGGSNQSETGTSGSWSLSVPTGGQYLWFGVIAGSGALSNPAVTVSIKTAVPTGALGLWIIGALIVLVGLFLRGRKKPASIPSGTSGVAPEPSPSAAPSAPSRPSPGPGPTPSRPPAEEEGEAPLE